jgi:hypothetical protein
MHGPRVNEIGPSKLPNPSESLKGRLGYDVPFPLVDLDEAVNWASDLVELGHGQPKEKVDVSIQELTEPCVLLLERRARPSGRFFFQTALHFL